MGYTTYTCSVCGDSYVGSYTDGALDTHYTAVAHEGTDLYRGRREDLHLQ